MDSSQRSREADMILGQAHWGCEEETRLGLRCELVLGAWHWRPSSQPLAWTGFGRPSHLPRRGLWLGRPCRRPHAGTGLWRPHCWLQTLKGLIYRQTSLWKRFGATVISTIQVVFRQKKKGGQISSSCITIFEKSCSKIKHFGRNNHKKKTQQNPVQNAIHQPACFFGRWEETRGPRANKHGCTEKMWLKESNSGLNQETLRDARLQHYPVHLRLYEQQLWENEASCISGEVCVSGQHLTRKLDKNSKNTNIMWRNFHGYSIIFNNCSRFSYYCITILPVPHHIPIIQANRTEKHEGYSNSGCVGMCLFLQMGHV